MATIALNIGVSVAIFTTIIVGLVTVLMVARSQLVAQGEVAIGINGDPDKTQKVAPGQSLLSALGGQKILIPSACGGGGTCAMCKCQVIDGGGDVLPTELGHLSLKERKDNWRLACQVKVKQDMQIKLPEEIFGIKKFDCVVRSNDNVATFIKELVLEIQDDSLHFESGGYIQIDIPPYACTYRDFDIQEEYHEDWDTYDVWKYKSTLNEEGVYRAYSMANHPAEGNIVMLNVRIATPPRGRDDLPPGIASSYIFNLKAGDKVTVSGPFGEFFIKETEREMVYIGGGAGMAPLRSHIFHLFHTLKTGRKVSYWYGARSMREVFYMDEFQAIEKEFPNFSFHLALSDAKPEDNWEGPTGFIHNVCRELYLEKHDAPEDCEFYTCGPPMMLTAVRNMLDDLGVPPEQVDFDDFGG